MSYPRLLATLRAARWAIQPASLQAIYDSLGAHLRGALPATPHARAISPEVLESLAALPGQPLAPAGQQSAPPPSPVAVIPVHGIIGKHLSSFETMCGGCDVDAVEASIKAALADGNTRALVLDFDSPGGVVTGVPELAEKIRAWDRASEGGKPIYAFTETLCASAAYWLASSCREIACTPTADLGSIGVYIAMVDDSEWWQKEGFKLELIKAGDYKAMGISGKPLTDAERALLQADVDTIYAMFTGDVREGRGKIADETMQGQTFLGQAAEDVNLVDGIVPDLASFVSLITAKHAEQLPAPAGRTVS